MADYQGVDIYRFFRNLSDEERGDSGLRSFCSVQGSLVMWPIATYENDEQKMRWLPESLTNSPPDGTWSIWNRSSPTRAPMMCTHSSSGPKSRGFPHFVSQ